MKFLIFFLILIFLPLTNSYSNEGTLKNNNLIIKTINSEYTFTIELAISADERSKGLMFRNNLKQNEGMLFIYPKNQIIKMWMKNTLIPLDMIFIDENGEIEEIYKMTTPNDLTPLGPEVNLRGVLEINGGLTTYLNIKKGDLIIHSSLNRKIDEK
jgi:uncharacterized protein